MYCTVYISDSMFSHTFTYTTNTLIYIGYIYDIGNILISDLISMLLPDWWGLRGGHG